MDKTPALLADSPSTRQPKVPMMSLEEKQDPVNVHQSIETVRAANSLP
jgi:hypothetical protein